MARDGGLAEFMTLPEERLLPVADSLPDTVAVLCEPFATATRAASRVEHRNPQRVAVLGPGTIGSMVAVVAELSKPDRLLVVGTPSDTERLELAREELGLETLVAGEDATTDIMEALGGPADVVFEAAGSPQALETGLEALAPGGEMVLVGLQGEPLSVSPGRLVRREISIRGSYAAGPGDWETALGLMSRGEVRLSPLVGPIFDLQEARSAFRATEVGVLGRALVRCSS
jgi:threonine dehydrogenase-like Zn-dependent dehydrogenase